MAEYYTPVTNTVNFSVAFKPTTAFPLDARSMFGSYADAEAAARIAEDAGSSNTTYYYGQTVCVFAESVATLYTIQGDNTLKEVGAATYGDDKTIVLDAENKTLSLKSFGIEYYAHHDIDPIAEGSPFASADELPTTAAEGTYAQIADIGWYIYSNGSWNTASTEPHTEPWYEKVTGWKAGLEPKVASAGENTFELAWYEPSTTTVEGLSSALTSVQSEVSTLTERVGTTETKISDNAKAIKDEVDRAIGVEGGFEERISNNTAAISVLNSDGSVDGSVKQTVNTAIAEIIAEAPASLDTLKEIADWIEGHAEDAAKMNTDISDNTKAIGAINKFLGTSLPAGVTATTVIDYIAEAVAAETLRAENIESGLSIRINEIINNTPVFGDIVTHNVAEFATAAQGALADSAVQEVTAGTANGTISVDGGSDVTVYTAPVATATSVGDVKPDDISIKVDDAGTLSVGTIVGANVSDLNSIVDTRAGVLATNAKEDAIAAAAEAAVAKDAVVTAAEVKPTVEEASDTSVVSEKALVSSLSWKTTM